MNDVDQQSKQFIQNVEGFFNDKDYKPSSHSSRNWNLTIIFFLVAIYILCIYCFACGNPKELNLPFDSDKHPCGTRIGLEDYKYIYFVNPDPQYINRTLCVKECPKLLSNQSETDESLSLQCHPNTIISTCNIRSSVIDPIYKVLYYDSFPDKNVCLPTKFEYVQAILPGLKKPLHQRVILDLYNGKYVILAAVIFCLFCNIVLLYLIQIFPQEIMWLVLSIAALSIVLTTTFGYILSNKVMKASELDLFSLNINQESIQQFVHSQYVNKDLLPYVIHLFLVQFVVFILFVYYKGFGLDIFAKQLKCISELNSSIFQEIFWLTIIFTISLVGCLVFWVYLTTSILTLVHKTSDQSNSPFDNFQFNPSHCFIQSLQTIQLLFVSRVLISLHITILIGFVVQTLQIQNYQNNNQNNQIDLNNQNNKNQNLVRPKKSNICENLIKGTFNTIIIGELVQSILDSIPFFLMLAYKVSGLQICSCLTKYNDRMYFLSYVGNLTFTESVKQLEIFDEQNEKNGNIQNYGEAYTSIIALTMCNLSTTLTYSLILYFPVYSEIHNPLILISVIYTLCYSISKLFGSMYGYTIEFLVATKRFKNICIKQNKVITSVLFAQEQF